MLRYALLGLLLGGRRHGYELRARFEELLAGTWPLNIGQVYTTLSRMERDGLVTSEVVERPSTPDRRVYRITAAGRQEVKRWLAEPVEGPVRLKDDLHVKVLVHCLAGRGDGVGFVWAQREQHLRQLADLTRLAAGGGAGGRLDRTARLLVEAAMERLESDLRWLDRCEEILSGTGPEPARESDGDGERGSEG